MLCCLCWVLPWPPAVCGFGSSPPPDVVLVLLGTLQQFFPPLSFSPFWYFFESTQSFEPLQHGVVQMGWVMCRIPSPLTLNTSALALPSTHPSCVSMPLATAQTLSLRAPVGLGERIEESGLGQVLGSGGGAELCSTHPSASLFPLSGPPQTSWPCSSPACRPMLTRWRRTSWRLSPGSSRSAVAGGAGRQKALPRNAVSRTAGQVSALCMLLQV